MRTETRRTETRQPGGKERMPETKRARADAARRPGPLARRRRQWAIGIALAVGAALVVGYVAYQAAAPLPGVPLADLGNRHVQTLDEPHEPYNSDPPTSGPHLPYLAPWGIHHEPIPRELQVHNLEDGGVLVQYDCPTGCPDLVEKLAAIVTRYPEHVILAPYPGMKQRLALTAWARLDTFDELDERRIRRFIEAYRGIDHHRR
jgi:hypothetical protein